ncbi:Uncharacterised protein [Streptococcus pneumoniae]|nr:Uncharacterised protein [Streptococcus pneumoniae]
MSTRDEFVLRDAGDPQEVGVQEAPQTILPSNIGVVDQAPPPLAILFATEQSRHIEPVMVQVPLPFHSLLSHKMPSILQVGFPLTIHLK